MKHFGHPFALYELERTDKDVVCEIMALSIYENQRVERGRANEDLEPLTGRFDGSGEALQRLQRFRS